MGCTEPAPTAPPGGGQLAQIWFSPGRPTAECNLWLRVEVAGGLWQRGKGLLVQVRVKTIIFDI